MMRAHEMGTPRPPVLVADGVRLLGLASIVVSVVWLGAVEVALFALVLLGLVLPRFLRLPGGLDIGCGLILLAAGWASVVDLYAVISWLDLALHFVATGVLTVVGYVLLSRTGTLPEPGGPVQPAQRVGIVLVAVAIGLALGGLWEFGEWYGHTYMEDTINVGYGDTLGDLAAGGLGGLAAGVALVRASRDTGARAGVDDGPRAHRAGW